MQETINKVLNPETKFQEMAQIFPHEEKITKNNL
jgi:hypothetical protein